MNAPTPTGGPSTRKGEETRDRILAAATELIHRQGFKETGLSDILAASGVPKGSFYHYFPSKEDLGRELLGRYRREAREHLEREAFPPTGDVIPQFVRYFAESARQQTEGGCKAGCLLGNLAAEITNIHEDLRREVAQSFLELREVFADALERGQRTGELAADFAPAAAAEFLVSVLEGSILLAKARREPAPFAGVQASLHRYLDSLRNPARSLDAPAFGGSA
jgi:TetR/AcrR family transcriptional regulator, transcriptional repressor for nem operon